MVGPVQGVVVMVRAGTGSASRFAVFCRAGSPACDRRLKLPTAIAAEVAPQLPPTAFRG